MQKLLTAIVVLGIMHFLPAIAHAFCEKAGHVVRVTANPGTSSSFIYYRESALLDYYWVCTTDDAKLLDAAQTAQHGLARVQIRGDAASCPTTPATGQRSAGTCLRVVVNP